VNARGRTSRQTQRGIATLELMLLAPFMFLVMLGMVQLCLVALAKSAAGDAALAAARADSLERSPSAAASEAVGGVGSNVSAQELSDGTWQVTIRVRSVFPGASVDVSDTALLP